MFHLESSISTWRSQLSRAGLQSPEVLDELETHLREEIEQQTRNGADAQTAFQSAVQQIGQGSVLKNEFAKIGGLTPLAARAKNTMLSFAGIPNHYVSMNAPSPNLDSRWATYLRSALFLVPAICLWMLASIFVIPQFHSLWDKASIYSTENTADFAQYLRLDLSVMSLFKDNFFFISIFTLLALGLLEWRLRSWPRYRRAVFGAVVFLVNLGVLLSFAVVFIGATLAATQFAIHAK